MITKTREDIDTGLCILAYAASQARKMGARDIRVSLKEGNGEYAELCQFRTPYCGQVIDLRSEDIDCLATMIPLSMTVRNAARQEVEEYLLATLARPTLARLIEAEVNGEWELVSEVHYLPNGETVAVR